MKPILKQVTEKIEKWTTVYFLSVSIFISVLLAVAIILAFTNQFRITYIYLSLIPAFVIAMFFFTHLKRSIKLLPKITVPVLLLILIISFILMFYPHDTFGGRDEAIYPNYAIHLTQGGSLNFSPYLNNLPDKYIENVRLSPPGYVVWLAIQQNFFGTQGLLRGNLILIILGLCSFFLVSSYFGGNKIGVVATILFSSSMPFLWFSRETMSENLSFFLLWSLILFFFVFLKSKRFIYLFITFLCSWLFALTRIEGFFIQLLLCFIFPITLYFCKVTNLRKIFIITLVYFSLVSTNIIIVKNSYFPFLKTMVSAVKYTTTKNLTSFFPEKGSLPFKTLDDFQMKSENKLEKNFILFYFLMLIKYNLLFVMFSIFLAVLGFLFFRNNQIKDTRLYFFIILAIFAPEFLKFSSLNVALDQPFMYRRYIYALLPLGYLCFSFFLSRLKNKKLIIIIAGIFFIGNVFLSKDIIFLKNNWLLIDKMKKITKNISMNDLVIIRVSDQRFLEYYYPHSYLILNKGIRTINDYQLEKYPFDPKNKIFNDIPYEKIYLLSVVNQVRFLSFTAIKKEEIKTDYFQLVPSCQTYLLGKEEGLTNPYISGVLSFSSVMTYCDKPGNEIVRHEETLYLYELVYDKI